MNLDYYFKRKYRLAARYIFGSLYPYCTENRHVNTEFYRLLINHASKRLGILPSRLEDKIERSGLIDYSDDNKHIMLSDDMFYILKRERIDPGAVFNVPTYNSDVTYDYAKERKRRNTSRRYKYILKQKKEKAIQQVDANI